MIAFAGQTRHNSIAQAFSDMRNDYEAAKPSRFVRRRRGFSPMGSNADFHIRVPSKYLELVEIARDIDRNDSVIGQGISRVVANVCQDGFKLDPTTPSKSLNRDLKESWDYWSQHEQECCSQGEFTFDEMSELALRAAIVDGDIGGNPTRDGQLETVENHRIRSSTWVKNPNIIHGVEVDNRRRRLRYHVTKADIDPMATVTNADLEPIAAYDNGFKNFFQLYMPKRLSQTRGLTALAPIAATASQHDDIQFAKLVQQQIVSCWAILEEFPPGVPAPPGQRKDGPQERLTDADGWESLHEKLYPGKRIKGRPGAKLTGFSPNIPNMEYFDHVRLTLTYIAINLDLPLIVLLLDATQTNFSGWRGAWDQAKMRLRTLQRALRRRWHKPTYLWHVRRRIASEPAMRAMFRRYGKVIFAHGWNLPGWDYIEPLKDASADDLQQRSALNSKRRIQGARGRDWDDVSTEIVDDNYLIMDKAARAYEKFIKRHPALKDEVNFREFISLMTPETVSAQIALNDSRQESATEQPQPGVAL